MDGPVGRSKRRLFSGLLQWHECHILAVRRGGRSKVHILFVLGVFTSVLQGTLFYYPHILPFGDCRRENETTVNLISRLQGSVGGTILAPDGFMSVIYVTLGVERLSVGSATRL